MTLTKKLKKELNRLERRSNKALLSKLGEDYVPLQVPKDWNLEEELFLHRFRKRGGGRKAKKSFNKNGRTMSVRYLLVEEEGEA